MPVKICSLILDYSDCHESPYELFGQVNNVVFPCGAVVIGEELFVYYGCGDSVIGVATIKLGMLLNRKESMN
jgi:predicted GH43/DUF377 family glycosyl hydrolase